MMGTVSHRGLPNAVESSFSYHFLEEGGSQEDGSQGNMGCLRQDSFETGVFV